MLICHRTILCIMPCMCSRFSSCFNGLVQRLFLWWWWIIRFYRVCLAVLCDWPKTGILESREKNLEKNGKAHPNTISLWINWMAFKEGKNARTGAASSTEGQLLQQVQTPYSALSNDSSLWRVMGVCDRSGTISSCFFSNHHTNRGCKGFVYSFTVV